MKFVQREHIDTEKWNQRIAESECENIFQYSWYLDACADHWAAFVTEDYQTILPIPFTKKIGIKRFYPAPFTREYDIIGNQFNWNQVIEKLKNEFAQLSFRNKRGDLMENPTVRKHQFLLLDENYPNLFRTNAKRLIKKGLKNFQIGVDNNPEALINLFELHVAHKIDSISSSDLEKLRSLMKMAIDNEHGELLLARDQEGELVAGGFFLKDKKRITYLKGAASDQAKKQGAMYALINQAMEKFAPDYDIFDFGGSDVENVAIFYQKFGAQDRIYYHYELDQSPFWFKTLKKLKKSK